MKDYEFYSKYANVPLKDRDTPHDIGVLGPMTLSEVYFEVKRIDDKIRLDIIRKEILLRKVEEFVNENIITKRD